MKMNLGDVFRQNERITSLAQHALAAGMVALFIATVVGLGEQLRVDWDGSYLPPLALLTAVEAMLSWRRTRDYDFLSLDWLKYRLAEAVVLIIGLKLVLYARQGFSSLAADVLLWEDHFLDVFFNVEFFFGLILLSVAWVLAGRFGEQFARMEGDEKLLTYEREVYFSLERKDARAGLAGQMMGMGALMAIITGFIYLDRGSQGMPVGAMRALATNLVLFFIFGLGMLSLSQLAILRVRWSLDRTPVPSHLSQRWVQGSLIFIGAMALLAFVLPTRYSVGLLDILRYLVGWLYVIAQVITFIVMLPLVALMALYSFLIGRPTAINLPEVTSPPVTVENIPPGPAPAWLQIIQSLIFWAVFLSVITFSIRFYLQQNQALAARLKRFPVIAWLAALLKSWWAGLRGTGQRLKDAAEAGLQRLRTRLPAGASGVQFTGLHRPSPRERILFYYHAMLRRSREQGVARRPAETPGEYAQRLAPRLPEAGEEVDALTGEFQEARYSRHTIETRQAGLAQRAYRRIRQALQHKPEQP